MKFNFLALQIKILKSSLPMYWKQAAKAYRRCAMQQANQTGVLDRPCSSRPPWSQLSVRAASFSSHYFISSNRKHTIQIVGYGHVTPLSESGKLFCMLYATIGIPLTLVLLSAVVERLLVPSTWLLGKLNSKLGHLYQPFNIRILHLIIIVAIVAVLFVGIPTIVFAYLEDSWDGLDAFYYCFISLTTIGLGDYIPGDDPDLEYRSIYKIGTTCYLIMGELDAAPGHCVIELFPFASLVWFSMQDWLVWCCRWPSSTTFHNWIWGNCLRRTIHWANRRNYGQHIRHAIQGHLDCTCHNVMTRFVRWFVYGREVMTIPRAQRIQHQCMPKTFVCHRNGMHTNCNLHHVTNQSLLNLLK